MLNIMLGLDTIRVPVVAAAAEDCPESGWAPARPRWPPPARPPSSPARPPTRARRAGSSRVLSHACFSQPRVAEGFETCECT